MWGRDLLLRHCKGILLLLLFAAICNVIVYLYVMESKTEPTIQSTVSTKRSTTEPSQLLGLGAMGRAARANWSHEQLLAMELSERETGYNAWLSERISPNRTLHDMRHRR